MGWYNMGLVSPMGARFPQYELVLSPVRVVDIMLCADSAGALVGDPRVSAWWF